MGQTNEAVLRCYAERDADGTWFAMCLDLNLYARADSPREAQQQLHDAIVAHLEAANEMAPEDKRDLVPRPAPLRFRLRYAYLLFKALIGALFYRGPPPSGSRFRKFDEPMAAA